MKWALPESTRRKLPSFAFMVGRPHSQA
jgi:hypothetical protein